MKTNNGDEVLFAIACDGAGSASKSEIGSKLTVESFIKHFEKKIHVLQFDQTDRAAVLDWLSDINTQIQKIADLENLHPREYACTALAAIVHQDKAIFFQVGDGAIVVSEEGSSEYGYMFWPQHGEFANQTNFLFQNNLEEVLQFAPVHQTFQTIILFTDGIERLVLDFSSRSVYSPSLQPIVDWLRKCDPFQENLPSAALTSYLSSDFINRRTDDDKTLVIATRVS